MFQQTPSIMVPFPSLPDGLYLVKRPSQYPLIEHYGVLIVGHLLWSFNIYDDGPVIIHRTDLGLLADWADQTGPWRILGQVPTNLEPLAIARFSTALQEPNYDLFTNNCEQFARFVTEGQSYSTQVFAAAFVGLVGLAVWAVNRNQ